MITVDIYDIDKIDAGHLKHELKNGWKVVSATPILRTDQYGSYTDKIIYIIEGNEDD